ncbi:MAG: PilZ domain-containing protein [Terriglobales bacterium]
MARKYRQVFDSKRPRRGGGITQLINTDSTEPRGKSTEERRRQSRTAVQLPVKVRAQEGDLAEHSGLTRDLTSSGIFLYTNSAIEPGAKLELVLMLPPNLGLGPGGWTMCNATVVRIEQSDGKGIGVAATLDRIERLPELI